MIRQAKTEQHGRSRRWMRWLVAAVAVLVLWSGLGLIRDRVPRYRGETAAYFFPKWTRLELWEIEGRWPDDAGADAMPFLVSFLARFGHDVDASLGARLADHWDELPEAVEKRLPQPVSPVMRMHLAIAYLGRALNTDPEALRVLADRFHELPEYAQGSLLGELPREPSDLNRIRDDLLRRALASQSLELQVPALSVVLQSAEDFTAYLPEVMLAFEAVVAGVPAALGVRFVDRLGALGPVARPAVPVLERFAGWWSRSSESTETRPATPCRP
jgi:hypothetical protein